MKKVLIVLTSLFMFFSNLSPSLAIEEYTENDIYLAYRKLSNEEKADIFLDGYKKIICYDNSTESTRGTHIETICTEMKKRDYGWIGYSRDCFQKTYTGVNLAPGSTSLSLDIGSVGVSVFEPNMSQAGTTSFSLTDSEMQLVSNGDYFTCLRFKGYITQCKYTTKVYNNNVLIDSYSYEHSYVFKSNLSTGLDYSLDVRSSSECSQIRDNHYVGTNSEKDQINSVSWKTVSNPESASILP